MEKTTEKTFHAISHDLIQMKRSIYCTNTLNTINTCTVIISVQSVTESYPGVTNLKRRHNPKIMYSKIYP
jgi:hypothetical protein